jgi:ketosteroid isomerase-like protein
VQRTPDSGANSAQRASTHSSPAMNHPARVEVHAMNTKAAALLAVMLSTSVPATAQQPPTGDRTAKVIDRFNQAFQRHDASLLEDLIAEDCVMESVEPAPNGTRVVGRADNLKFWTNLANNKDGTFEVEDVVVFGERANVRWRYRFGPSLSQSVRGVTLMRLRDGLIVEALAYAKTGDASVSTAVRDASGSQSR